MEIEYKETRRELEKLVEKSLKGSSQLKKSRIITGVLSSIFIFFGILMLISNFRYGGPFDDPIGLSLILLLIIFPCYFFVKYVILIDRVRENMAMTTMKGKNIDTYLGKNKIRIDEKGIHRTNRYREEHIKWNGILRIDHTKEHIFVHDTDVSALIIPKKAFGSSKEMNAFVNNMYEYRRKK